MTIVMKFGGTSVGDGERIRKAAALSYEASKKEKVCVVVSAMSGMTDKLLDVSDNCSTMTDKEIISFVNELRKRHIDACKVCVGNGGKDVISAIERRTNELEELLINVKSSGLAEQYRDKIASYGEKLSAALMSGAISAHSPSEWFHGDNGLIVVDNNFISPEPDMDATDEAISKTILPKLESGVIPVITGYMGCTLDGHTITLGRGSSDHIASIVAACVGAREVQIWTDVDGLLTADPKVVPRSKLIRKASFKEASELAYFGAKILHPKTLVPAITKDIPVRILNTCNPESPGTTISKDAEKSECIVKAITSKKNVTMLDIISSKMLAAHGFLARVFEVFARHEVSIDLISTTEVSVSLTIDGAANGRLKPVIDELSKIATVKRFDGKALVCVVGEGMRMVSGTAGRVFTCLGKSEINVECISQGASEVNISIVVNQKSADDAVKALHEEFFSGVYR